MFRVSNTLRNALTKAGRLREQEQPCHYSNGPGSNSYALAGRRETFDRDRYRDDSHRAEVHHPDDEQDRHLSETTAAAMQAEPQAVPPGRAGIGRQRVAGSGHLPAAAKVTRLPLCELERAGHKDDHTHRHRNGSCQYRLLHFDHRQRNAERIIVEWASKKAWYTGDHYQTFVPLP